MSDEVDQLVADWARERPDLDVRPMQILSRITRISTLLDRARQASFSEHDLLTWEFDVLAALRRSGEPYCLSPGQLLRETMVTSGTMTNRVDRLASRDLVTRQTDPRDRRGVIVQITDEGRRLVDGALAGLLDAEQQLLVELSGDDRVVLADLLRKLGARLPT